MAYRRPGRPTFYAQLRTRNGWKQWSLRTPDKRLADRIEGMWETLAADHRAWEVLDLVLQGQLQIGALFDLWRDANRNVVELERRLADVNLEPLIADFLKVHRSKVRADSLRHIEVHLRALLPEGAAFPRSRATTDYLTKALYAYVVREATDEAPATLASPGTIRKVHSDWSVFFTYCTDVKSLFERSPMDKVARPPVTKPLVRFYELDQVERLIGAQPTPERRALFALLYGSGIEISVALLLTRADLMVSRKEVRAAGTKTHTRDRMARVSDWAWPILWAHAQSLLPGAPLFPGVPSRYTASDWHAEAIVAAKLSVRYPMKNARHHWAARMLRSGAPIGVVQRQLGHATAKLTLDTYGPFIPSGHDRDRWEQAATDYDTDRREAK